MEETFDTYQKKSREYYIVQWGIFLYWFSLITVYFFTTILSNISQWQSNALVLLSLTVAFFAMFMGGSSINFYNKNGEMILTDSSVSVNNTTFPLYELAFIETYAGSYKGLGTRAGLDDGINNRIKIVTKNSLIIETKFVVLSKRKRDNLTKILKVWRQQGFKIISNGIDLI